VGGFCFSCSWNCHNIGLVLIVMQCLGLYIVLKGLLSVLKLLRVDRSILDVACLYEV
jgi:hypothetical protein